MKTFTVCFEVAGWLSIEAETANDAIAYLNTEDGQEAVNMLLQQNDLTITEIIEGE